jgi:hypothetical protein
MSILNDPSDGPGQCIFYYCFDCPKSLNCLAILNRSWNRFVQPQLNELKFESGNYHNVKSVVLTGSGDFEIDDKGKIISLDGGKVHAEKKGDVLHLSCSGGRISHSVFSSGGNRFSQSVFSSGSANRGGVSVIRNGGNFLVQHGGTGRVFDHIQGNMTIINGQVYIGGRRIEELGNYRTTTATSQEEENPGDRHFLHPSSLIKNVKVCGSGSFTLSRKWMHDSPSVQLNGSGDFTFPPGKPYESVVVNLYGSGDIVGKTVGNLNAKLYGSGDISGFHITNNASLRLYGSGDINVTKTRNAGVSRECFGSGDIFCR